MDTEEVPTATVQAEGGRGSNPQSSVSGGEQYWVVNVQPRGLPGGADMGVLTAEFGVTSRF